MGLGGLLPTVVGRVSRDVDLREAQVLAEALRAEADRLMMLIE